MGLSMRDAYLKVLTIITFILCVFSSAQAQVVDTNFVLVNRSKEPMFKLFLSPLKSTGWGKDIFGEEVLMPGYEQPFNAGTTRGCVYDIRVEYKSKKVEEKRNLNLCQLERVIFDGSSAVQPTAQPAAQSNQNTAPAAPRPTGSYEGSTPLRCGDNVNCRLQSEVVQKMQI
jgi:hypothetical protein